MCIEEKSHPKSKEGNEKMSESFYSAERVIGNGAFGVVYQAKVNLTGETVAIKKVLNDLRFMVRAVLG